MLKNKRESSDLMKPKKDETITLICDSARKFNIDKIILFGSRAKKINSKRSDYDLLVYGDDYYDFYSYMTDEVKSLDTFDISNGYSVSKDFFEEIQKTGVVIYEKTR